MVRDRLICDPYRRNVIITGIVRAPVCAWPKQVMRLLGWLAKGLTTGSGEQAGWQLPAPFGGRSARWQAAFLGVLGE